MNFASIICALSLVLQPAPAGSASATDSASPEDNGWEEETAPEPAPEPGPSPPPPSFEPTPAQQQPADQPKRRGNAGTGLIVAGAVSLGVGAVSLLFIALPAAIVKTVALDRASRDPLIESGASTREDRYRRARRADDAMEAGFWIGITGIGVGIPLVIAGAVIRSKARSQAAQRITPTANGIAVRF